jgi:hypothetical protein
MKKRHTKRIPVKRKLADALQLIAEYGSPGITEEDLIMAAKKGFVRMELDGSVRSRKFVWEDYAFDEFLVRGYDPVHLKPWQYYYDWVDDAIYGVPVQYLQRPGRTQYRIGDKIVVTSGDPGDARKRITSAIAELTQRTRRRKSSALMDSDATKTVAVFMTLEEIRFIMECLPRWGLGVPIKARLKQMEDKCMGNT